MLPFKFVTCQSVIKLFLGRLPVNQMEIFAVVLQMAANAVLATRILHLKLEVIAVLGVEAPGNFFVAIEALKRRRAGSELMAARALRCACQGLMRFGKRPGGDLPVERRRSEGECKKQRQAKNRSRGD